jgi:hypothetical protein
MNRSSNHNSPRQFRRQRFTDYKIKAGKGLSIAEPLDDKGRRAQGPKIEVVFEDWFRPGISHQDSKFRRQYPPGGVVAHRRDRTDTKPSQPHGQISNLMIRLLKAYNLNTGGANKVRIILFYCEPGGLGESGQSLIAFNIMKYGNIRGGRPNHHCDNCYIFLLFRKNRAAIIQ